jgi:integrase
MSDTKAEAKKPAPQSGTLSWLWDRYRETTSWSRLSNATRRQRENIMKHVLEKAGHQPYARITTQTIMNALDKRRETPAAARHFLETMRGLYRWDVKAQHCKLDPTAGVDNPFKSRGDGHAPWTEDEIAQYEARWPIGTRERVWLDVLIYTGLRRGDAVRLGRQHVRNGRGTSLTIATIKTEKTDTEVSLPIISALEATLKAGPCGDLTFITGDKGRPLTKESFGNLFRKACRQAGLQGRSAHGLRKAAATRAANAGATVAQLEAIFGWQGGRMASLYTRAADRRRLSQSAMHLLAGPGDAHRVPETDEAQTPPTPQGQNAHTGLKAV